MTEINYIAFFLFFIRIVVPCMLLVDYQRQPAYDYGQSRKSNNQFHNFDF